MLITQERILEILKEAGVLLEGHFLLTSGRHSNKYLQCAKVFRNTKYSEELCSALAEQFRNDGVEVVIGPAMGAVQMAYEVSRGLHCENFFAERDQDGKMCLRRGFEVQPGQKVLLVEDVVTTGGSVREVLELVKAAGGDVVLGMDDLLTAHGIMTRGLVEESGMFRTRPVGVVDSEGHVLHFGTLPQYVPDLVMELLDWAKTSEVHMLIRSCVFHHEFELLFKMESGLCLAPGGVHHP